uniref:Tubulin-specific chaperone A n=1 Tax=Caenorhabditis tropicalis TaxID=1561998 RepID=A0A1I7TWV9_9PELO
MQRLANKDRLDVFDKETRAVIEADMIKMGATKVTKKPYKAAAEALGRLENKVSKMAADEDELFESIYEKIQKTAEENDKEFNQHETLENLMKATNELKSLDRRGEQSESAEVRRRRYDEVFNNAPKLERRTTNTVPPRRRDEDGINYSYYVLRVVFMIFLIFIVPFVQSYFKQ